MSEPTAQRIDLHLHVHPDTFIAAVLLSFTFGFWMGFAFFAIL